MWNLFKIIFYTNFCKKTRENQAYETTENHTKKTNRESDIQECNFVSKSVKVLKIQIFQSNAKLEDRHSDYRYDAPQPIFRLAISLWGLLPLVVTLQRRLLTKLGLVVYLRLLKTKQRLLLSIHFLLIFYQKSSWERAEEDSMLLPDS